MDDITYTFLCKGMCSLSIKLYGFQNDSLLYNDGSAAYKCDGNKCEK